MKNLIAWIKNNKVSLSLALALFVVVFVGSSRYTGLTNKVLKLNEHINIIRENNVRLLEENKYIDKQNKKLLEDNKQLDQNIGKLEQKIEQGNATIAELRKKRPAVTDECKPLAEAMQKEIDAITAMFSLAIQDMEQWKAKSNNFQLTYNNQIKITSNLNDVIRNQGIIITDKDKTISIKDKSIQKKNLELKIYKAGGAIALAVILFTVIKK